MRHIEETLAVMHLCKLHSFVRPEPHSFVPAMRSALHGAQVEVKDGANAPPEGLVLDRPSTVLDFSRGGDSNFCDDVHNR